ncbi:MAG: AmmeMemoRadiSam system protein B, partial [Nitrospirota bacterium]
MRRQPVASGFYRGDIKAQVDEFERGFVSPPGLPGRIVAGIVPHAGWFFSGAIAAKVFLNIKSKNPPRTFIMFGAVHNPGVRENSIYAEGSWDTPIGPVKVNSTLAGKLLSGLGDVLEENPDAHMQEHSIEVQVPMIRQLFPEAMIVPIAVPGKNALELGRRVGRLLLEEKEDAVVIGS